MRQDTEYFHKYNSSEILQRINEDTNVSSAVKPSTGRHVYLTHTLQCGAQTFAEQAMAIPFDMVQISSNLFFNAVGLYTIVPKQLFMVRTTIPQRLSTVAQPQIYLHRSQCR